MTPRRVAASYTLIDVASNVVAVAGLWLLVRHLSVTTFGLTDLLRTLQVSLVPLVSLNAFMSAGRSYFEAGDDTERRRILGGALLVQLAAGVVGAGLVVLGQPLAARFLHPSLTKDVALVVAAGLPATGVVTALTQTVVLSGSVRAYAAITLTQAVLNLGAVLVCVVWWNGGVRAYFVGLLAAASVTAIGGLIAQRRAFALRGAVVSPRAYLRLGGPYTVAGAIQYVYVLFVRIVLVRLGSGEALGFYALAERLQQPLTVVVAAVGRSWVPWLLREPAPTLIAPRGAARDLNGMVLVVLTALVMFLPELIAVLGGTRYDAVYPVAVLLLVGNWLYFLGDWLVSAGLFVAKQSHHAIWIYLLAYGGAAALCLATVPRWGSVGAAVSAVVASTMIFVAMFVVSRAVWPVDLGLANLLPGSAVGIAVGILAGALVPLPFKPLVFAIELAGLHRLRLLPLRLRLAPSAS
jgi:O-antigen/teichoic acid export membrane protein